MGRANIVNRIPDLQIEWATRHAHLSIRDFVLNIKKMSERQYRYILSRSPLIDWSTRREEIQNQVTSAKIEGFAENAAKAHHAFVAAASLGIARVVQELSGPAMKPSDLSQLAKALVDYQTVFHRAMGVPEDQGLMQVYLQVHKPAQQTRKDRLPELDYESVKELIDYRREMKRNLSANA